MNQGHRSDLANEKRGVKLAALIYEEPEKVKKELLSLFEKNGGMLPEGEGRRDRLPPSIRGVASTLGVTVPTVRRWLQKLGIDSYQALAKALGMPAEKKAPQKKKSTK